VEGPVFSSFAGLVFGAFAWLQFPALCGFMFSSTRAGAGNFRYALILGVFLAALGLVSGLHAWLRSRRRALAAAALALNLSFVAAALAAPGWFDASCHALYVDVTE